MWKREILGQVLSSGNTRTLKLDGPPGRCIRYFFLIWPNLTLPFCSIVFNALKGGPER